MRNKQTFCTFVLLLCALSLLIISMVNNITEVVLFSIVLSLFTLPLLLINK